MGERDTGAKIPDITHYPRCTADYPEKPEGEGARPIMSLDIGDGETVYQCGDCGAYVVESESGYITLYTPVD